MYKGGISFIFFLNIPIVILQGFDEKRVRSSIEKLRKAKGKSSQTRMDSFFKVLPTANPTSASKRKIETKGTAKDKKAKK